MSLPQTYCARCRQYRAGDDPPARTCPQCGGPVTHSTWHPRPVHQQLGFGPVLADLDDLRAVDLLEERAARLHHRKDNL